MYDSPIHLLMTDIHHQIMEQQENEIYKAVLHYVPYVDKEELIRALQYDREQYQKGYADGHRDAEAKVVRCKDCKRGNAEDPEYDPDLYHCALGYGWNKGHFYCAFGERKDGDGND